MWPLSSSHSTLSLASRSTAHMRVKLAALSFHELLKLANTTALSGKPKAARGGGTPIGRLGSEGW